MAEKIKFEDALLNSWNGYVAFQVKYNVGYTDPDFTFDNFMTYLKEKKDE